MSSATDTNKSIFFLSSNILSLNSNITLTCYALIPVFFPTGTFQLCSMIPIYSKPLPTKSLSPKFFKHQRLWRSLRFCRHTTDSDCRGWHHFRNIIPHQPTHTHCVCVCVANCTVAYKERNVVVSVLLRAMDEYWTILLILCKVDHGWSSDSVSTHTSTFQDGKRLIEVSFGHVLEAWLVQKMPWQGTSLSIFTSHSYFEKFSTLLLLKYMYVGVWYIVSGHILVYRHAVCCICTCIVSLFSSPHLCILM